MTTNTKGQVSDGLDFGHVDVEAGDLVIIEMHQGRPLKNPIRYTLSGGFLYNGVFEDSDSGEHFASIIALGGSNVFYVHVSEIEQLHTHAPEIDRSGKIDVQYQLKSVANRAIADFRNAGVLPNPEAGMPSPPQP